ncbi:MAG: DUF2997 domain-containing protein [Bdellovibrionota bacterium]
MATKLEMIIVIKPDGEIELKTVGMKGTECDDELKPLEKELGGFSSKTYTSERHEKAETEVKKKVGKK